jgi:succinyl-CoA synthetase alpha subunit
MGILADRNTAVVVVGITGRYARAQTRMMREYGTLVVAGVVPGRGGQTCEGVPVHDSVADADLDGYQAVAAVVYVPAAAALGAVLGVIDSGVKLLVVPTEGIPLHDQMKIRAAALEAEAWVVGPNTAGMIVPGETLLGSMAPQYSAPGRVGVISRSGTLTHETAHALTQRGYGQSTSVHIGGDPVIGGTMSDYLRLFEADPSTEALVVVGEIGGSMEEELAAEVERCGLPMVAFVAGRCAPRGRRMGHAGALVSGAVGSAETKRERLEAAGVVVADTPWDIPSALCRQGVQPHVREAGTPVAERSQP